MDYKCNVLWYGVYYFPFIENSSELPMSSQKEEAETQTQGFDSKCSPLTPKSLGIVILQ